MPRCPKSCKESRREADPECRPGRRARAPARCPAFWYEGGTITWNEFDARIGRVAAGFRKLGIGQGDVVSLWLPNTPAWLVCFFGLARIGAMVLATNMRFRSGELKDILFRSGARAVVWHGWTRINGQGHRAL